MQLKAMTFSDFVRRVNYNRMRQQHMPVHPFPVEYREVLEDKGIDMTSLGFSYDSWFILVAIGNDHSNNRILNMDKLKDEKTYSNRELIYSMSADEIMEELSHVMDEPRLRMAREGRRI